MFDAKVFADNVRALRTSRGLSQDDLAAALGVTKTFVSDIERSRRTTTIEKLIALADYFDVSLDWLVGRLDDPKQR